MRREYDLFAGRISHDLHAVLFSAEGFAAALRRHAGDSLDAHGQQGKLRHYLWAPLCVSALNTLPESASANVFLSVLRDTLAGQPRAAIIAESLASTGGVLAADTLEEAVAFAGEYAAEHLLLALADPDAALAGIRNTGTVFLGQSASVAFGDYMTGANHVLPTGGSARSYSGLSTLDFVRWTTYQRVSPEAAARIAEDVTLLATAEGLPGHAEAARAWRRSS